MMRTVVVSLLSAALFFQAGAQDLSGSETGGDTLLRMKLPIPKNQTEREYLGLKGSGTFRLEQIDAKILVVEIFSMYCPVCQKEAPSVNDLYRMIEKDDLLRQRVKMIGIGAGNSAFEVNVFKDKYSIPFPLFPDEEFSIHKTLGEVRTPHFIVYELQKGGQHHIIYSISGFPGLSALLERIVGALGSR